MVLSVWRTSTGGQSMVLYFQKRHHHLLEDAAAGRRGPLLVLAGVVVAAQLTLEHGHFVRPDLGGPEELAFLSARVLRDRRFAGAVHFEFVREVQVLIAALCQTHRRRWPACARRRRWTGRPTWDRQPPPT